MGSGSLVPSLTIADLCERIRSGELSPVDIVNEILERIGRLNSRINAFVTIRNRQELLNEAEMLGKEAQRGEFRGPLHGIPLGIKDNMYTAGIKTTGGSRILGNFIPDYDATCVSRLRKAGAIVVGKLNLDEFGYGARTVNPHYGNVLNPWDRTRMVGGSSGGSAAAVAAGLIPGATGSDTGGSIRIPASLCGVVGLKPTYGLVSRHGVLPLAWSLDHIGPIARSVRDVGTLLGVMSGEDQNDSTTRQMGSVGAKIEDVNPGNVRIGVPKEYLATPIQHDVRKNFSSSLELLENLGFVVEEVDLPYAKDLFPALFFTIVMSEASAFHESWFKAHRADYAADVRDLLLQGYLIPASQYLTAQRVRQLAIDAVLQMLNTKRIQVLAMPTTSIPAPRIESETLEVGGKEVLVIEALDVFTAPFNVLGVPALSVPNGFTTDHLPTAIQFASGPFREQMLLSVGHVYEQNAHVGSVGLPLD